MGTEKAAHDADIRTRPDAFGGAQHLELGAEIEAVAGLDLDGRDALARHGLRAARGGVDKLVFGSRTRRLHGGDDAAPCPRDLLIACPIGAHVPLMGAVAGEDQMGVAVDEVRV